MYNWQLESWPKATVGRAALEEELKAFKAAFLRVQTALQKPQNPNAVMNAMVDEAMKTSAIEGVRVDESVVMSSICKALGMTNVPLGFTKDVRAEGVAQMVLSVKADWNKPISAKLIRAWHAALLANDPRNLTIGDFRSHAEPMRVVRRNAYGEIEIRFEAPPSTRVPEEIATFVAMWKRAVKTPEEVALKCTMIHPHFESIHPFEDGNGRVGRALVAKTLSEGLGASLVLPVSLVIDRYRKDYYEAINIASQSLDWTGWAKFFIPVLTETLNDFVAAAQFVAAKGDFLSRYESQLSERAKKVIVRVLRDGPAGVAAGLSAAKWMRMTKVSKPTATRDLEELVRVGAIIREGDSVATRYRLNFESCEPIDEPLEPINDPLNEPTDEPLIDPIKAELFRQIVALPGINRAQLAAKIGRSVETVKRAVAKLIQEGKIEHRGSKKTGGYWVREFVGQD